MAFCTAGSDAVVGMMTSTLRPVLKAVQGRPVYTLKEAHHLPVRRHWNPVQLARVDGPRCCRCSALHLPFQRNNADKGAILNLPVMSRVGGNPSQGLQRVEWCIRFEGCHCTTCASEGSALCMSWRHRRCTSATMAMAVRLIGGRCLQSTHA